MRQASVPAWQQHLQHGDAGFRVEDLSNKGTLLRVWSEHWSAGGGRAVLIDGRAAANLLTGSDLDDRTAAAAGALSRLGVAPADRVLWSSTPTVDSAVWLIGALRLGAVVVPVSPNLTPAELAYVAEDVRPAAAILQSDEHRRAMADAAAGLPIVGADERPLGTGTPPALDAAQPDDDALIVYTSGTTGKPKGAVHTHGTLLAGVESIRRAWGWGPEDRLILTLPLFHVHGLCAGLFGTLAAGASATVMERFDPDQVFDAVPTSTMLFGVPTMYHRLCQSNRVRELASLRLCVSGSAPLAVELSERLHAAGVSVLERYGMSETLLTVSNPLVGERRPGSVGLPLPGTEIMVADPDAEGIGELLVRGPSLCRGYWERPEATSAWNDGWFATGDLASVSDDGYVAIRGRTTELIITGGHNVYPAEVESVLARHPSVGEIAVAGMPSAEWGESVVAFVVGSDGPPDLDALRELAGRELAPFKRPREFRVVAQLPRNALGKVLRRELR